MTHDNDPTLKVQGRCIGWLEPGRRRLKLLFSAPQRSRGAAHGPGHLVLGTKRGQHLGPWASCPPGQGAAEDREGSRDHAADRQQLPEWPQVSYCLWADVRLSQAGPLAS